MGFWFLCCTEYENENESRRRLDFAGSVLERDQKKEDLNFCVLRNGNRVGVGKTLRLRKLSKLEFKKVEANAAQKGGLGWGTGTSKFTAAALDSVQV